MNKATKIIGVLRTKTACLGAVAVLFAGFVAPLNAFAAATINEYTLPTANSHPHSIVTGSDGNLWFTEYTNNEIGKITTGGTITEYGTPTANSGPHDIAEGPDGDIWFTEVTSNKIGKITTSGVVTEYSIPTAGSSPYGITAGAGNTLWFAEYRGNKVGKITTSGVITEYPVPTAGSEPFGITTDSSGNAWFAEFASDKIGEVDATSGNITEYNLPAGSGPISITRGPGGDLWFVDYGANANKIGKITTSGVITEYPVPTANSMPRDITQGPGGLMWFTESTANKIGNITSSGQITEFDVPTDASQLLGITTGPDGNLWFAEYGGNKIGMATNFTTNYTTVKSATDSADINITAPAGTNLTCAYTQKEIEQTKQDPGFDYPLSLLTYCLTTASSSNQVSLTFATDLPASSFTARKFDPVTKTYSDVSNATITQTTLDGKPALRLTYVVQDNGPLDANPAVGIIEDPVGLAVTSAGSGSTLTDTGLWLQLATVVSLLTLAAGVAVRYWPSASRSSHL